MGFAAGFAQGRAWKKDRDERRLEEELGKAWDEGIKMQEQGGVFDYIDATGDGVGAGTQIDSGPKQYGRRGLGGATDWRDTPYTKEELMRGGYAAQADLYAAKGKNDRSLGLRRDLQQLEDATLSLDAKKRAAADEERFRAIQTDVESWRSRLNSSDKDERLKAWQEMTGKHTGSDWGGRTFSKVEGYGQDGKLYAYVANPDTGKVMPIDLDDPAMTDKILDSYATHQRGTVSPQAANEARTYRTNERKEAGLQRRHEQSLIRYDEDRESRERMHAETQRRLAAVSRGQGRQTASEAFKEKANAMADVYLAADETGKLTKELALKRAYQVLARDPDAKDGTTWEREIVDPKTGTKTTVKGRGPLPTEATPDYGAVAGKLDASLGNANKGGLTRKQEAAPAVSDIEVQSQRTWGHLTPDAMVTRGAELGIPGALEEQERRTRRFQPNNATPFSLTGEQL